MIKRNGRNEERIKVMWLSINASLFHVEKTSGGWTSSLEAALKKHYGEEIEIAVVFEGDENNVERRLPEKYSCDGSTYYRISNRSSMPSKVLHRPDAYDMWEYIRPEILAAIEDFKPDVIQCFGSEWPYGMIADYTDIPVIIHMQGFLNEYKLASLLRPADDALKACIRKMMPGVVRFLKPNNETELEADLMSKNHYFMGRTEWDRNIVKHFSPGAKYYKISEAMRPEILEAAGTWTGFHHSHEKLRLLTISQASFLKGNDIILYAARIMKELLKIDFEWRIAGSKEFFMKTANRTGIVPEEVNIKLLDRIPVNGVIREMTEADFFIHPSIIDNSPNAICEAQIIGCPVVASRVGGVPDLVKDGDTGLLYPYNEPYTLAFIISDMISSPELVAKISANATDMACKRHDPEMIADAVYNTYLDVIADHCQDSK